MRARIWSNAGRPTHRWPFRSSARSVIWKQVDLVMRSSSTSVDAAGHSICLYRRVWRAVGCSAICLLWWPIIISIMLNKIWLETVTMQPASVVFVIAAIRIPGPWASHSIVIHQPELIVLNSSWHQTWPSRHVLLSSPTKSEIAEIRRDHGLEFGFTFYSAQMAYA